MKAIFSLVTLLAIITSAYSKEESIPPFLEVGSKYRIYHGGYDSDAIDVKIIKKIQNNWYLATRSDKTSDYIWINFDFISIVYPIKDRNAAEQDAAANP